MKIVRTCRGALVVTICVVAVFVGGVASAAEPQREGELREGERPREPQTNVVRIMSYNVRHCRGADSGNIRRCSPARPSTASTTFRLT